MMAFLSTKKLKALSTKHVQGTGALEPRTLSSVDSQADMEFHKPTDLKLANESTADEGLTSAQQESSSDSDWESGAACQAHGCTSSGTPEAKAAAVSRPRVATEPTTAAAATKPRLRASTLGSSTAWTKRAGVTSQTPEAKIQRAVRAVLNKLTIEKFELLYETLVSDCGLSEPEHLSIVMREVFEKATTQHHFIEMYADLCVRLESDPWLARARGEESAGTSFKHLLLTQCQLAFERLLTREEQGKGGSREDRQEQELLRRRRALGNVKLVGNLMVRGMLSSRLLVACCDALLRGEKTCQEALESLAALLTVTGKSFDGNKEWQHSDRLSAIFAKIEELQKEKRVPARARFLLRDLLDLRAAGWPARGRAAVAKETPKTLEAIQAEWSAAQPGAPSRLQPRQPARPVPPPAPRVSESQLPMARVRKAEAPVAEAAQEQAVAKAAAVAMGEARRPVQKAAAVAVQAAGEFSLKIFRKDLAATLKQLSLDRNVAAAVRRVRGHQVPEKCQAREMTDLLTRAAEEPRGPVRRSAFAFACGLGAADPPAFSRSECLKGVQAFFEDVSGELVEELPRLPQWISGELVPTLKSVFPEEVLKPVLPAEHQ